MPVQLPAGPGTPLAQDIHQQLAQDLLGLNWFLGCCFGFGLLRGKVLAEEPLRAVFGGYSRGGGACSPFPAPLISLPIF